ncbi:hypothetical protein OROMI_002738 [Orobanche minor]
MGMGRMIIGQVYETYNSELARNLRPMVRRACSVLALCLRTSLSLPWFWPMHHQAVRGVEADSPRADGSPGESDWKRSRRQPYSRTYKMAVNLAAKIPVQAIANALRGQDSEHFQGAVRVLDIALRQNVAQKMLKILRIKDVNTNLESKIADLRDLRCKEQSYARWFPCNVIPRRHTKSRQKPQENMSALQQALNSNNYVADSLLVAASIDFTRIQGQILAAPRDFFPCNGRWNFNQKVFSSSFLDPQELPAVTEL